MNYLMVVAICGPQELGGFLDHEIKEKEILTKNPDSCGTHKSDEGDYRYETITSKITVSTL